MKRTDRLNWRQRSAIKEWNNSIPFDFMYIEEINAGRLSFAEAWSLNVDWMNDWVYEATESIDLTGCGMLKDFLKDL